MKYSWRDSCEKLKTYSWLKVEWKIENRNENRKIQVKEKKLVKNSVKKKNIWKNLQFQESSKLI